MILVNLCNFSILKMTKIQILNSPKLSKRHFLIFWFIQNCKFSHYSALTSHFKNFWSIVHFNVALCGLQSLFTLFCWFFWDNIPIFYNAKTTNPSYCGHQNLDMTGAACMNVWLGTDSYHAPAAIRAIGCHIRFWSILRRTFRFLVLKVPITL